ncbi:MAG: hypothetical protein IJF98_02445 [Firmicutes bacterium]|nr:hypothetical protein [Bacillota bacterium]
MNIITFIIAAVVAFVVQIVINKMANNQLIKFIPMGIIMVGMIICLIIYMGVFGSVTESALAENRAFAMFFMINLAGALIGTVIGIAVFSRNIE